MNIDELFEHVADNENISDLHLTVFWPPLVRIGGVLETLDAFNLQLTPEHLEGIARELMNEEQMAEFEKTGGVDFCLSMAGTGRFRVNAFRQRGSIGMAIRVLTSRISSLEELGMPTILKKLARREQGLILCTGPAGNGKSTTLAALIEVINGERRVHVMTLEDPIEYLHRHNKAIVHQREIGIDTPDYTTGLKTAMHQDPDVIMIGKLRGHRLLKLALEAAETGHLILGTLPTASATQTVKRIINLFPPHTKDQIRTQLAAVIEGVISQQLVPRKDRQGNVAAVEVMLGTPAVRKLIRENKLDQIHSTIQTGGRHGMQTMDNHLVELARRGHISRQEVLNRAANTDFASRRLPRQ